MYIIEIFKKTLPLYAIIPLVAVIAGFAVGTQYYIYNNETLISQKYPNILQKKTADLGNLDSIVTPKEGVSIGIKWKDLGKKLADIGVIDQKKMLDLFKPEDRDKYKSLLNGNSNNDIVLTKDNSRFVLNTFWAMGLAQKSDVLSDMQANYDKVDRLASTGGWTIGRVNAMEYYGKSEIVPLDNSQQKVVMDIVKNIYRPCCNNHTAFADCNHGMAMLGLVELMVANGYSESTIYDVALKVNSYWFPDTYKTLASYFESEKNTKWDKVNSKLALSKEYSSGSGYQAIKAKTAPVQQPSGGGGCGV